MKKSIDKTLKNEMFESDLRRSNEEPRNTRLNELYRESEQQPGDIAPSPKHTHQFCEKSRNDLIAAPGNPGIYDASSSDLTNDEKGILKEQSETVAVKTSFLSLYRYANSWDLLIITISALCAIAAGAGLPLLSLLFGQLATAFQRVTNDDISYDEFMHQLIRNVLYYVYIGVAEFVTIYISTVGFTYTGERVAQKIREEYLAATMRQNMSYFDNLGAGEVTTRITSDTNLIQDGISQKIGLTLTAVATFISSVIIAFVKYWKLALICTPSIVCLVGAMVIGYRLVVNFTSKMLQSTGEAGNIAEEVIGSIRTVAAFGTHKRLADQYDGQLKEAERHGVRMQITQSIMVASLGSIMFMTQALSIWQGSRFLVGGEVNVGEVLTITMAMINGSFALGSIAPNFQAFTSAIAATSKIYSAIDRRSPLDPTSQEGEVLETVQGFIELRNVKHIYPARPEVTVMDKISLCFPAGQTTAIVGPSGSGKSTIVSLLERFYKPVSGCVLLDGHNIESLNLRWLRQQMSLVSQERALFSTTIFENIRFGLSTSFCAVKSADEIFELVQRAAKMANAHDFIISLPNGYRTLVGERGFLLSGGQKQRIAIARAVVSDPKILILDEATSALDTRSEKAVQVALDNAAKGRTTIVIAHRLSTIKEADNIVVLAGGMVAEQGSHDQLLRSNGLYVKLVDAQRLYDESNGTGQSTDNMESGSGHESNYTEADLETPKEANGKRKDDRAEMHKTQVIKASEKTSLLELVAFIASFNKPELKAMMIGLAFVIASGGGQPAQSVIYSKAIASLSLPTSLHNQIRQEANFWAILLLVLGLVLLVTNSIHLTIFGVGAEKMIRRARRKAFETILRQDISFFDTEKNPTGALLSFLSTETKNLSGISGVSLSTILILFTWLTAATVIALALGWKLALVCIAIVPVVMLCGSYRISMLAAFQAQAKQAYEASASYACEVVSSIRTVASLCREDDILTHYRGQLKDQIKAGLAPALKSALFYALSQGVYHLCTALAFWYGGTLLAKHEYTIFQFFVCFTQIIFSVNAAASIFANAPDIAKAKNAAVTFKTLFSRKPAIDTWSDEGDKVDAIDGFIEFRHVDFEYPTRPAQKVLSDLSLNVRPGQYAALVGASGSGKSTAIGLLERFYNVQSGQILVDGKDISSLNVNSYRRHLALVSQETTLYQGTIRENILLGSNKSQVSDDEIIKACKESNIYDLVLSLPDGLNTIVGSKGTMLSGGQKQRIAIARALIRNPKILLLDEATSALDSDSEKIVQATLDAAARGRTTIAVAHRLSTIQKAHVIFVFDKGRIVEKGTHQELLQKRGAYYEYVKLQDIEKVE